MAMYDDLATIVLAVRASDVTRQLPQMVCLLCDHTETGSPKVIRATMRRHLNDSHDGLLNDIVTYHELRRGT